MKNYHYSGKPPTGKMLKIGVWEKGDFKGCVLYGCGANPQIGAPYNLTLKEVVELTRVAIKNHQTPMTRILSLSFKILKKTWRKTRLIVSYADPNQGHVGVIYQAGNWFYVGQTQPGYLLQSPCGELHHPRSFGHTYRRHFKDKYKTRGEFMAGEYPNYTKIPQIPKHKYLMPLDRQMKKQIAPLAKPYP